MNFIYIFKKFILHIKFNGIMSTLFICAKWIRTHCRKKFILLTNKSLEDVFHSIYKKNHWDSKESLSGEGSELVQTVQIRKHLPKIFKKYTFKSILDAPCGDFNWMKEVLRHHNVIYTGGDIVKQLVDRNNLFYSSKNISFIKINICVDQLPENDVMICRDCLFHLSYNDIFKFFQNFINSNIGFLLITTHKNYPIIFKNNDIKSGDFRLIDFFNEPFNLPKEIEYRFDDYCAPSIPREMCLFRRDVLVNWLNSNQNS